MEDQDLFRILEDKDLFRILEDASSHRREERCFKDIQDLITRCGCTVEFRAQGVRASQKVGHSPFQDTHLAKGGRIIVRGRESDPTPAMLHEAIHHFHGEAGLNDEGTMMAMEFALYTLIKSQKDRRACLLFFTSSHDEEDEIACQISRNPRYFSSKPWRTIVKWGQPWVTKTGRVRAAVLKQLGV